MYHKFGITAVVFAAAISVTSAAFAGASDYTFEPVKAEVKKGDGVTLAVRLVHKPTGKPVSDAVLFSPRIDMSYGFKTDLVMAGGWLLTVSAKVQGEPETVTGKITFKATD
jgi:hypothetical protein